MIDFLKSKKGAIGIGTLIIFIAMVLVAAVAAAVIINTASNLQHKASRIGQESTKQVASGLQVLNVYGYAPNAPNGNVEKLLIIITPNVGDEVDLSQVIVTLSNGKKKVSLVYGGGNYTVYNVTYNGATDLFNGDGGASGSDIQKLWNDLNNSNDKAIFGLIILHDDDSSLSNLDHPTANFGDKVAIAIALDSASVNMSIAPRDKVSGEVIPEYGAPGIIDFKAPSTFTTKVVMLQ
ncbi:flagellin [Methanocaldococcus villosus KIN24-T80]|uniref:Flagellin n=1 Tax=Methanocaldococcus villosus KIN24-T80 TaxID=1069083 RepID=N6VRQ1_9EURY|nr:flagellin [Methanocaldococcus villosus]ENN95836.1 flagellin [Methanocaldococcus villosus KIN24-T80]